MLSLYGRVDRLRQQGDKYVSPNVSDRELEIIWSDYRPNSSSMLLIERDLLADQHTYRLWDVSRTGLWIAHMRVVFVAPGFCDVVTFKLKQIHRNHESEQESAEKGYQD